MATGAAVKGSSKRAVRYPAQLVIMVSEDTVAAIERYALNGEVSKSFAARASLEPGVELTHIAEQYGVSHTDLVNAARLWAIKEAATSGAEPALVLDGNPADGNLAI